MLESFYIRRFRSFREVEISRLGRVNLIVGKNSVGKTTLLEALWLYAAEMRPEAIRHLLMSRDEVLSQQDPDSRDADVDVKALFFGRQTSPDVDGEIVLGPVDDPSEHVRMRLTWVERMVTSEPAPSSYTEIDESDIANAEGEVFPAIRLYFGSSEQLLVRRYDAWFRSLGRARSRSLVSLSPFLRAGSIDPELIGRWWDAIALTEAEGRITKFLELLVPIERVTLVEHPRRHGARLFVVRLSNQKTPQPLRSLGDGVERVFHTALAIEYARSRHNDDFKQLALFRNNSVSADNILLIDEIESGVHYSALPEFWRLVFEMAHQLDVQVFATTHSWDCIEGFQHAATADRDSEGMLIRLEREGSKCNAVLIDERDLEIVTRDNIEIR